MAFKIKEIIDLKGILLLMLLTIPSEATNFDCHGKAFHCVNPSHFMICVDLGTGISMTIDDVVIPCPAPTVCRPTNRFECEFLPPSTSAPIEVSTIANIVTSPESEITTFIPLDTTSIPFDEYFNTVSPTTLSETVQQTTESPLTVQLSTSTRVSDIASPSKSEITDESVSRNATAKPGTTIDVSTESNIKQNNMNNSYVDQISNTILNLDVIPYEAGMTIINNQEVVTAVPDTLYTQGTDSPLNTQHNYFEDITTTSIITEQTKITEELFTPNFQDLTVNEIIPEHLSIASYTTVEPTTQIEEMISTSDSTSNAITIESASLGEARTNIETTTNIISKNDIKPEDLSTFYITNTQTPMATSISDQLNANSNNTEYEAAADITITEAITEGVPNNTYYKEFSGSTSTPVHVVYHNNLPSASDSEVTAESIKEVKANVNVPESYTELFTRTTTVNTGASSTTEPFEIFSNVANANNNNIEINGNISYKRNNVTTDDNKQDFSTGAVAQEPVTELSFSSDSNNLENLVSLDVDTTTLATISESLIHDTVATINLAYPTTAYYNDNLKTLANPSTTVMAVLDLGTENVINNNRLQSATENNSTIGNITNSLKLNENVISTKYENNEISTLFFKSDLNSETSTHSTYDLEQANEFSTKYELPLLAETTQEATQIVIAKDGQNVSTENLDLDLINKISLHTETTTQHAFSTLSINILPITTNETDIISAAEITNQIKGIINVSQLKEPTKDTDIVSTNEHTNNIIFSDQNKMTDTAANTINKLLAITDTVESYNILYTENIESVPQTNTIPKDTSTSLPTAKSTRMQAPLALPEYILMKPTEKFQGETITFDSNFKTRTETDMTSLQPTTSDTDPMYKSSLQTENTTLTSPSISPINATDIVSAVDIKNDINDIDTASNDGIKTFMNIQSVLTNKLSTQSNSLPPVEGYTDKMVPLDQNTFTDDAYGMVKSLTTTTTMDPNNIMTKDRLLLTNTILLDTTSLSTTKIRSFENYPSVTVPNNINDITMTVTDMPLQSTSSDLSLPTVDSLLELSVENTKLFNNRETDILLNSINNHTLPESNIMPTPISSELNSTATVGDEANTYGTDVWNKNENEAKAYSLNKAVDVTVKRNILTDNITSTSMPYPFAVSDLLFAEGSDVPAVDIVGNLAQKPTTADTNKNTESMSKTPSFQWTSPTIATDTIYDVTMTDSTIVTQLTYNVNMGHGSNPIVEMLLSNSIMEATTARTDISNNTVKDSVDPSINVKSNVQRSPNSISDVYSQEPSISKPDNMLNTSTLIQDLAQTLQITAATDTTKHITDVPFKSPDNKLFTQNNSTMQTTEAELVARSNDSPIRGNNFNTTTKQVFVTSSYDEPLISSLQNVTINLSSLTVQNQESILSVDNLDFATTTLNYKNEEVVAGINLSKLANTSMGGNKRSNIINTELNNTTSNVNNESNNYRQAENKSNIVKTTFTPVPLNLGIKENNLSTANKSSNQHDKYSVITPKILSLEKSKGTFVTSTPSSNSMQTENTTNQNNIGLYTQTISSPENLKQFVTDPIESELLRIFAVTERPSKLQKNNILKTTHLPYDATTPSIGTKLTAQTARLENLSNSPAPVSSGTTVTKPPVEIYLPLPIINLEMKSDSGGLEKFKVMHTAQDLISVGSSTLTEQLPLSGTETSSNTVKIESLEITTTTAFSDTNQGLSKPSKDTVAAVTNLVQTNFSKRTDDSLLLINHLKTDNNVPVTTDSTSNLGLKPETWTAGIKTNANSNKANKGWESLTNAENKTPSILQQTSVKENKVDNATQSTLFSSVSDLTSTDSLVNNNTDKTHSDIISLITPPTNQGVTKEKEKKSDNKASKIQEKTETSSDLVQELAPVSKSSYIPSHTSAYLVNSKKEELIQTKNNNFKPTTGISSDAHYSSDISKTIDTGMKTAGSESNKETLTLETIENSTLTNGSHTSNSKSKDQNRTVSAYNTTVISNDQRGTPRYTSYTKSTAAGDGQTTELPAFESSTRKSKSNFTCKQKKRGKYADELNCRKFYICLGNSYVFEGTCPVNTVFSEIRKQCTKNLSHCIRNNQFRCVTEGRFGDFLNDNVYYICAKNNVSSFIRFKLRCQNGYYLNKTFVRCVLNNESQQSSASSDSSKSSSDQSASSASKQEDKVKSVKKFKCKKEGIFPDPSDCQRYFECKKLDNSEYRQKRKKCGNDETFNRDKKKCVEDDSYECK